MHGCHTWRQARVATRVRTANDPEHGSSVWPRAIVDDTRERCADAMSEQAVVRQCPPLLDVDEVLPFAVAAGESACAFDANAQRRRIGVTGRRAAGVR